MVVRKGGLSFTGKYYAETGIGKDGTVIGDVYLCKDDRHVCYFEATELEIKVLLLYQLDKGGFHLGNRLREFLIDSANSELGSDLPYEVTPCDFGV